MKANVFFLLSFFSQILSYFNSSSKMIIVIVITTVRCKDEILYFHLRNAIFLSIRCEIVYVYRRAFLISSVHIKPALVNSQMMDEPMLTLDYRFV